jgi:hypothetical protein
MAQPNEYKLKGGEIHVTYLTDGFHDVPSFAYDDGQLNKVFTGPEIRTLQTEIGTLVSVTTRLTIDTGSTEFSVLLPAIDLADSTKTQHFKTAGIITVHKGPDSFPRTGLLETYEVIHMHGTASIVEVPLDLAQPVSAGAKT